MIYKSGLTLTMLLSSTIPYSRSFIQHNLLARSFSLNFLRIRSKYNGKRYMGLARLSGGSTSDFQNRDFTTSMVERVPDLGIGTLKFTPAPEPSIKLSDVSSSEWSGDLLSITVFQSEDKEALAELSPEAAEIDRRLGGLISGIIESESFKGASKSSTSTIISGSGGLKRIALFGLGKSCDLKSSMYSTLGASISALIRSSKCETVDILLPNVAACQDISKLTEGIMTGLYLDDRYKSGDNIEKPLKLASINIFGAQPTCSEADISNGISVASGVNIAKDMVNAPPNFLTPESMATTAEKIASEHGLNCKILEEHQVRELGMGAYLGVSQGSILPPKFIHLTYTPQGEVTKRIALVGKGLTFDSGGYNIKAGAGSMIELMKFDMGGAAATLGTAKVIGKLAPKNVEVHFIVAACENMISDRAMHPGDILTASNGKTIEVLNTDAEGRLTLADALVYAEHLGVDYIVDCATLTGAAIVALGPEYACLYSSDEDLAKELLDSSNETGDKVWRMPLPVEYVEMIKSKIADLKNIGGKGGGSITAALFLKEFIKDTPWAHIDLAGPVWNDKEGATGFGVRMLTSWILKHAH